MNKGKLFVVGIGPGSKDLMNPLALKAIKESDVICGYKTYIELIEEFFEKKQKVFANGMRQEKERVKFALESMRNGKTVSLVCGGDPSLYGLASFAYEMSLKNDRIEVIPAISAAFCANAVVGAIICEDVVFLSMSDLLTPWELIKKRIDAVNMGDFVTAIYNPKSKKRDWQLKYTLEKFFSKRGDLYTASVKNCHRKNSLIKISKITEFDYDFVDMFTVVLVGNTKTYLKNGKLITPRGYSLSVD